MIEVVKFDGSQPEDLTYEQVLGEGKAVQGYILSDPERCEELIKQQHPTIEFDFWITERQDDTVMMLTPIGTSVKELPSSAMCYWAFNWSHPAWPHHGRYAIPKFQKKFEWEEWVVDDPDNYISGKTRCRILKGE